jgi:hypothetical protein
MNHWTAEADVRTAPHVKGELDETRASSLVRQQRQADALYGLHNYLVLDSLLKRHLHLDKGFDL